MLAEDKSINRLANFEDKELSTAKKGVVMSGEAMAEIRSELGQSFSTMAQPNRAQTKVPLAATAATASNAIAPGAVMDLLVKHSGNATVSVPG
eukprot:11498395-Heterocapsa_arctica.AAC.1